VTFPYMVGRRPAEFLLRLPRTCRHPNRMNWNDPKTDEYLKMGKAALSDADRAKLLRTCPAAGHRGAPVDAR